MLRRRLQQGVCFRTFRSHITTPSSRPTSGTLLINGHASQSSLSRLLVNPRVIDSLDNKHTQTFHEQYFSTFGPESSNNSPAPSEKFSAEKLDRPSRRWKTEPGHSRQSNTMDDNSRGFKYNNRYKDYTRRVIRPQEDLGGHFYNNYKPRAPTRRETKPPVPQSLSQVDTSFDILQAIRTTFPYIEKPTPIQARLIPAIMQGHDVILMDETGSGKTFGSVLALIPEISRPHVGITTLYVVPHRDLAYQIESWCQKLVIAQPSTSIDPSSVVRVIARPNTTEQTFAGIRKNPPRILVSTPGALIDAMQIGGLRLENTLRRIVIDEVDAVMKIPLRYHQVQLRNRHTPEVAQVIDNLLRLMWEDRRPKPQMVTMSATLKTHVRSWLFKQKGWMSERVVRLHGIQDKVELGEFEPSERTRMTHSAVVVETDGRLRNLNDEQGQPDGSGSGEGRGILSDDPEAILELLDQEGGDRSLAGYDSGPPRQTTTRLTKGLILPPTILEAIATSVALDVSHRALLVIPAGVSINPVVETLRGFGVEARILNFQEEIEHVSTRLEEPEVLTNSNPPNTSQTMSNDRPSAERDEEEFVPNPTLLVATTTAVRGIDIPTLSHVYIVGGLESEDAYRHVAGRAGRFGMRGTVISFVGADGTEELLGGTGERRIRRTFERIGVQNTPFPHV
ncbi:unnamed protein product [Rhizoctonia solani]|uniref:ATP-dependent RNA helicase n=1 Tax=Rhizoctonia solani TaxID=456999 RepID=A0A8H2XBY5_9AGAM|nr:unnamed protein product [Rhizoctonia solani]